MIGDILREIFVWIGIFKVVEILAPKVTRWLEIIK